MKKNFFSKITNYIEVGKQKIKEKISATQNKKKENLKEEELKGISTKSISRENEINKKNNEMKKEDIFKIEEEEGGEVNNYIIKDAYYSDEEENDEEVTSKESNIKTEKGEEEKINVNNKEGEGEAKTNDNSQLKEIIRKEEKGIFYSFNNEGLMSYSNEYQSEQDELFQQEKTDEYRICHYIKQKGSLIDISNIFLVACKKLKPKSKVKKMFGFSSEIIEVDYFLHFDEYYLYPIKNEVIDKENINFRRVGNKYDLRLINNISIKVSLICLFYF